MDYHQISPTSLSVKSESSSIQDQVYKDKLKELQSQLKDLEAGTHPEFVQKVEELKLKWNKREEMNELIKSIKLEQIIIENENEKQMGLGELNERKSELMDTLLNELDEKRKQIEHEYHNMDLTGDCVESKPMPTRKLRRRPNEPVPLNEKNHRKASPQLSLRLMESEIEDDMKTIGINVSKEDTIPTSAIVGSQSPMRPGTAPIDRTPISCGDSEATMDRAQLVFENKCFLRGQSISVETSDLGTTGAVIQTISSTEVVLKTIGDQKRITITLNDLHQGKALIKKLPT